MFRLVRFPPLHSGAMFSTFRRIDCRIPLTISRPIKARTERRNWTA